MEYTRGGTPYLSITMCVRQDVQQASGGCKVSGKIWVEPKSGNMDYVLDSLSLYAYAAGIPEGTAFLDYDDFGAAIKGRNVRVTIEHQLYQGKTTVVVSRVSPSEVQNPSPSGASPASNAEIGPLADFEEIPGDPNLPF